MRRGKNDPRRIYIAVQDASRTPPKIDWTKVGIAQDIGCHRNSLVFRDRVAIVKGWLVYEMEIEPKISTLRRKK